jgi:hypothetical protein
LSSLDFIIPLDSYLLPHPAVTLDYIPAVAIMVDIDDRLEREEAEAVAAGRQRVNRQTGRVIRLTSFASRAPAYARQLAADLDAEALEEVRSGRLDITSLDELLGGS